MPEMAVISLERVIERSPQTVFNFVATHHFENHPKWDPDVLEMRQTSPGALGKGTTARIVRRQGGRRVDGTVTVTQYEPDRCAAWDVRFGSFMLHQRVEVIPEQGGAATRLRLSIETKAKGPTKLVVPLLRPRFRKTMNRSLARIDDLLGR